MILQALRDAGAPQGARVYMEGFSQGGMIAYNMANSTEVAKEINIVGVYAQASPLRGLPAKRRDFAVDYVEGDGDWVPDSALRTEGGWRPDERDTAITNMTAGRIGKPCNVKDMDTRLWALSGQPWAIKVTCKGNKRLPRAPLCQMVTSLKNV